MTVGLRTRKSRQAIGKKQSEEKGTRYIRDPAAIRKVDALVIDYPDTFKCIGETDIDKTYEMPKSVVTYRKPRRLVEEQREAARQRLNNNTK